MPGFTFEKISPPVRRTPVPPAIHQKPRGAVVRMLERFVELRERRKLKTDVNVSNRRAPSRDDV